MIKFVYFDLGEVMFSGKALNKISLDLKVDLNDFMKVYTAYDDEGLRGELNSQKIWSLYKKELGIDSDINNYAAYFVSQLEAISQSHELARSLSESYKIGLLTNIYDGYLFEMLLQEKIPNLNYDAIISSSDVGFIKPEREIYEIALRKSGVTPSEILFVDDKKENVVAAEKLGWRAVQLDSEDIDLSIKQIMNIVNT